MTGHLRVRLLGLALLAAPVLAQVVPDIYIVELTGDPVIALGSKSGPREAAGDRRARIMTEQSALRQAVRAIDGEVISSVQIVANALVVRIPDSRAGDLERLPGVARVHQVREAKMELDQALPLHRVPEAWTRMGGAIRGGAGVKIGLIDSGIETSHPAFDDPTLIAPNGFPKTGAKSDESALNNKIIVVRDYESMIDPTLTPDPKDHNGHGTAVAMVAAGMPVSGPYGGAISGVAPKAYIGVYKVFPGARESTRNDIVLKALDDAVADGMDVINISLGVEPAQRPEDDMMVSAVERATAGGVIVTKSAGNSGPTPNTLTSPASAPSGITVGAQWNQRDFAVPAAVIGGKSYEVVPGSGPNSKDLIEAPLVDVAKLDDSGQACGVLAERSLLGKVAFIVRGGCVFEDKLNSAKKAGAVAALLYSDAERPDPVIMSVGAATLPAVMVSYADGILIKQRLAADPALTARLRFELGPVPVDPLRLASFSSRGPSPDYTVKPDLVAAGAAILTAAQSLDQTGEIFSLSKFAILDGTSFSAPMVAGAAAVLKSARPGLTVAQYRSLLINSASPLSQDPNGQNPAQQTGAGMLNLDAALRATVAVEPVSVSFGIGDAAASRSRELTITNLDRDADELAITVEPAGAGPAPTLSLNQFTLEPGASKRILVELNANGLAAGECQGILRIRGARSGVDTRIAYWFAVLSGEPRYIYTIASTQGTPTLYMRAVDRSGVLVNTIQPTVTVVSGEGSVTGLVQSVDSLYPGYWRARLQLGPQGASTFRVSFDALSKDVLVRGGN
ncbi:MAG: S8 family serine peptidase [Acidobacteriota bacterium]